MKSLVIAEKPSVAADLARALGKVPKKGDVYENDEWVISSAVGHVVELEMPEDIDKKKYGFWRLETLPIIPEKFGLKPIEDSKEKFSLLKKLLARKDIDQVINACDAGREGELIFVYLYQLAKAKQPVKRAWMQSMTTDGIQKAFAKLRDGSELSGLADAARCRSESDWLIGINGTRALTKRMFGSKAGNVASVGRVQTPTLAIVYTRELEIRNFKPRAFWRLTANFEITQGTYEGVYQKPSFKKDAANDHDRADRLWEQASAEAVLADCQRHPTATVRDEKKPTTQASPRLYDLTTLQREANGRFGLSARRTLQIAQALYERHKLITYPRTDSRALPEDYAATVRETMQALSGDLSAHAAKVVQSGWIRPGNKKIFNNAQISDHFAIIPTTAEPKSLDEMEAKVYDMIARRFVATFYPEAQFDVTTRISTIAGKHDFKTEGKVLTEAGWLAVYGKSAALDEEAPEGKKEATGSSKPLPALAPADAAKAKTLDAVLHAEATRPPPRYTEATLLSAMEGAGKLVEDEDMAEAMKERGLGTPATRADTIDGLINQKYMERAQRELVPTPKAESLLQFLAAVKAEALTSPAMTGDWEFKLRQMEQGRVKRDAFMKEVIAQTVGIVERVKGFEENESNSRTTDIVSPTDGKPMFETLRGYKSQDDTLIIYKVMTGRKIEEAEVRQLVTTGEVGPLDGFVSPRSGARFAAKLKIVDNEKAKVPGGKKIAMDFGEKTDVGDFPAFWTDPKSGAQLCEAPTKYVLREKTADGAWEQTFSLSRILCKRELTRDDLISCITTGRTPLIENFISKFGRPFKAYLVRAEAKANFEFPPREAKTDKDGKPVARRASTKTPLDLAAATKLGASPAHKDGQLYQTADAFVVAKPGADASPRAVFQTKLEVAGKKMTPEIIRQLLTEGRTELIDGFMSKAGRAFSAYLVLSKDKKKAEFEFPPR
ncbi:type IA DNA topoisomerase [bacterium]|jgi:DNA topoisomerase-3|nr:type IA DNA topoisomerase [bacterium]